MDINCKNNCLEEYSDKCVLYTGPDFEKFKIKKGEYYDKIIVDLLNELQKICDQTVDLSCVFSGECDNCEAEVKIPKAVESIIDKICALTASDIKYDGDRYCIGESSISSGAIHLLGKNFKYNVEPNQTGSLISYNLTDIIKSLPSDYKVGRIRSVVSGSRNRGKTIILDSDKSTIGATISNDRFPINVDIDMRVNTPSGDVKLVKSLNIPNAKSGTYSAEMNVQDFGTESQELFTLKSFTESMAAQICANKSELDSLKNIDLPGCSEVNYASTDFRDILAQHGAILCDILKRLNRLESVTYSIGGDECGVTSYTESTENAINRIASMTTGLTEEVIKLGGCSTGNCGK